MDFQSADTLVLRAAEDGFKKDGHFSAPGRNSPLDFLAQASMAEENHRASPRWITTVSDGREKITVVPGPAGASIRLHRGNGRLPPIDLSKPFAKKCRNRECNNLGGQPGKPRSIYCSKRCQSREQNLRQGRIKNVRSPTTVQTVSSPNTPNANTSREHLDAKMRERARSVSPRSSSDDLMEEDEDSPELEVAANARSPNESPVNFGPSPVPFARSPTPPISPNSMRSPSPIMSLASTNGNSMAPPTQPMAPSPLNIRLGMTPSPLPSPSPLSMVQSHASSFSPVPMGIHTPIFLPRPAAIHSFAAPGTTSQPIKDKNVAFQSTTFSPPSTSPQGPSSPVTTPDSKKEVMDHLTLAPLLS